MYRQSILCHHRSKNNPCCSLSRARLNRQDGSSFAPALLAVVLLGALAFGLAFYMGAEDQSSQQDLQTKAEKDPPIPMVVITPEDIDKVRELMIPEETAEQRHLRLKEKLETLLFNINQKNVHLGAKESIAFLDARAALIAYIAGLDPDDADILRELLLALQDDEFFLKRYDIIQGLGRLGGDEAAIVLADYIKMMDEINKVTELSRSIKALGVVNNDMSYELLSNFAETEGPHHRHRFVKQLGIHDRRKESVPMFLRMASSEPGFQNRNIAAQALKRSGDPTTAEPIEVMLETEEVEYIRQTLVGALGDVGNAASLPMLEHIVLNDPVLGTQLSAINSIVKIGKRDNQEAAASRVLEKLLRTPQAERVIQNAELGIADLKQ